MVRAASSKTKKDARASKHERDQQDGGHATDTQHCKEHAIFLSCSDGHTRRAGKGRKHGKDGVKITTGKGNSKQGKGARGGKAGCARSTPDGKPICFKYNSQAGCNATKCSFLHACGKCFAMDHPMHACPHAQ